MTYWFITEQTRLFRMFDKIVSVDKLCD